MRGCRVTNLLLTQTHTRLRTWSRNLSGNTLTCITGLGCLIRCIIKITLKAGPLTSVVPSLTFVLGLKKCTQSHMRQQASQSTLMTLNGLRAGSAFIWITCCVPKWNDMISSILLMYLRKFACLVHSHRNANVTYPTHRLLSR